MENRGVTFYFSKILIDKVFIKTKLLELSKFETKLDFIIKGFFFFTIVFIFNIISTTFQPICPPAFFRCLSNLGTYTELWTTSFIESRGGESPVLIPFSHNQVLSIPVLLLTRVSH